MPSYLDFDSTKNFRDKILGKTLNRPNGPQTFTKTDYGVQNTSDIANKDLDNVDTNRGNDLLIPQNSNTFKPEIYTIKEDLNTLPRRSNLNLYPYFPTNGESYNLIGIMNTDQYEMESELSNGDLICETITDDIYQRLATFANVLITAHQGFFTSESLQQIANTTLKNLQYYFAGKICNETFLP